MTCSYWLSLIGAESHWNDVRTTWAVAIMAQRWMRVYLQLINHFKLLTLYQFISYLIKVSSHPKNRFRGECSLFYSKPPKRGQCLQSTKMSGPNVSLIQRFHYSELHLIRRPTPEMCPPLYSGHFEMSKYKFNTCSSFHPSNWLVPRVVG